MSQEPSNSADHASAGKSFCTGLAVGAAVAILGNVWGATDERAWMAGLALLPPAVAATTAAVTARMMGSSAGRILALVAVAVLSAFFLQGVLGYITLYDAVVTPALSGAAAWPNPQDIVWRWQIMIQTISIIFAGVLGLLFGGPGTRAD